VVLWAPAAALAAGILGRIALLVVSLALLQRLVWTRGMTRSQSALLVTLNLLLYIYGSGAVAPVFDHVADLDAMAAGQTEALEADGWVASYPQPGYGGVRFEFLTIIDGFCHRGFVRHRAGTAGQRDADRGANGKRTETRGAVARA
jgi:hypothetical protein